MTAFTKDPRSPEVLAVLKKEGRVLLEVTFKCLYVLDNEENRALPGLVKEWFVTWNGRSHAYRDGCHVGGGNRATEVRNLTNDGKVILTRADVAEAEGDIAGFTASANKWREEAQRIKKPENPYQNTELAVNWETGYAAGLARWEEQHLHGI
jgi:hypothetical protein